MKKLLFAVLGGFLFVSFQSCTDSVDSQVFHYSQEELDVLNQRLDLPTETYQYPIVTNGFSSSSSIDGPYHKATLGRVLFYDKLLSQDESTACASCHSQETAFADNKKVSEGIEGRVGTRNSLPLGNTIGFVRYYGTDLNVQSGFFSWDESKMTINEQSEAAITNPDEMGHDMWTLVEKVKEQDYYQILFKKVYGDQGATKDNIVDAITEFVNSMSSRESKFDEGTIGRSPYNDFVNFDASENRGKQLFNEGCGGCHGVFHNAIVLSHANNGIDAVTQEDKGVGGFTNNSFEMGVFKVPSLRNIELTAPYMHDGRFETLEQVIDHYSTGIQGHQNLHNFLKDGNQPMKFNFSETDKTDIINYLKTLTDQSFVSAEKYSDPFK